MRSAGIGVTNRKFTVPNVMTVMRMFMALVAAWWLFRGQNERAAVALCVAAALLDWFDGWYARKFSQVTYLGKHLDPLADKMLMSVVFVVIAVEMSSPIVWGLVLLIAVREIAMTVFRCLPACGGTGSLSPPTVGENSR